MSLLRKSQDGLETAVAWAVACFFRTELERFYFMRWPAHGLTAEERKRVQRALSLVEEARSEIQRVQGSLSKRTKAAGRERPEYQLARDLQQQSD